MTKSTTKRITAGEYLYSRGQMIKRIKRNSYDGTWSILPEAFCGAPPFAVGFTTKSEAVRWLDETWSDEEVGVSL